MPTDPPFSPSNERHSAIRLVEVMQREPMGDLLPELEAFIPEACETEANPQLLEQAKGALMLHFGIDSHQAFAMLVSWARTSRAPVPTIAHTLLRGICEGNPQTEARQRSLMRWLEGQLRNGLPDHERLRTATTRCEPAHESPRPD
jgi:hypothetical protein